MDKDEIYIGETASTGQSVSSIDINKLTEDDIGTEVWVWDSNDKLLRGVISDVQIDDKIDIWHTHKTVHVVVDLANGKRRSYDTDRGVFFYNRLYDAENVQKLIDMSNKRKGIDQAAESMSRDDLFDLSMQSGLKHQHKKFDSPEFGPDAEISIGSHLADTELILYCYISPAGGGHVNHGSTIEVGYAYVNGRLKRHKGAFDMPAGRGWIDNKKVQPSSINQFNHDVEVLENAFENAEQYTSRDIMKML